ncbi:MAG: potassium-transporting ATPase subunit C, partial [Herminiimonas sp.]|nr:potassium-transporting ATPase subunit C [Herminiimonas sp.]
SSPRYFWGRPSATSPMAYNAASSSGANFGPTNPALIDEAKGRIAALKTADPDNQAPIPVDLVTSSASGLDPEISVAAIYYQIARVARERKLDPTALRTLVDRQARTSVLGFLGEPRVNVLVLNLALDRLQQNQTTGALPEAGRRASLGVDSSPDADA